MITSVHVNHMERNYFNDYTECRSDTMVWVDEEKLVKAIDKLHRRYREKGEHDVMFVEYEDGSGYRLLYDLIACDRPYELRLRHYTNFGIDSYDAEETVSLAEAKRRILKEA